DSFGFTSFRLGLDPAKDLITIKDELAAGPGPEVRQSLWEEALSYGPGRAADQLCDFGNAHGPSKFELAHSRFGAANGSGNGAGSAALPKRFKSLCKWPSSRHP